MKNVVVALAVLGIMAAFGCVLRTEHKIEAHVVVDIRQVSEQADNVLDFIEGKSDTLLEEESAGEQAPGNTSWLRNTLDSFSPVRVAYADELKSVSEKVTEIAKRLRERFDKIERLRKQRCAGENNRGYVELRACEALDDAEARKAAGRLLEEENADRKALYEEIVKLNEDANVQLSQVERIYAQSRLERAQAGELFQLPPVGMHFDEFKQSEQGRKLGNECVPNAWVTIK
jgi:uncharacterized protein YdbL (DUF1318 family)